MYADESVVVKIFFSTHIVVNRIQFHNIVANFPRIAKSHRSNCPHDAFSFPSCSRLAIFYQQFNHHIDFGDLAETIAFARYATYSCYKIMIATMLKREGGVGLLITDVWYSTYQNRYHCSSF